MAPRGGRADAPFVSLESGLESTSTPLRHSLASSPRCPCTRHRPQSALATIYCRDEEKARLKGCQTRQDERPRLALWARSSPPPLTLRSSPLATRCFATPVTAPCTRWAASHTLGSRSSAPWQPPLCRAPLPSLAPWARSPRHGCVSRVTPFATCACYHRCPSHRVEHVGATGNSVSRGPTDTSLALLCSPFNRAAPSSSTEETRPLRAPCCSHHQAGSAGGT